MLWQHRLIIIIHATVIILGTQNYQVSKKGSKDEDENEVAYNLVESETFSNLIDFIRNEMLPDKMILLVVTFVSRMEDFFHARGSKIKETTKKHIRRKLESEAAW